MNTINITTRRDWTYYLIVPFLSLAFLFFANITTGIRSDHILLVSIINVSFFATRFSRRLITGLGVIIVYWIIFDSMKVWPNYAFNEVHIQSLYDHEKNLFGINQNGTILTPNEYLISKQFIFLDIACSLFYLMWVPLPLVFSIYLYSINKNLFLRFCFAFFFVNILGWIIYYTYPAAPPWYIADYGSVLDPATKSNAAGLLRFDHYFGVTLFGDLYAKGSNVFAAMPSLHASYPMIGLFYAFRQRLKFWRVIFGVVMIGIWFSAIYLNHHYIIDILAGIACGVIGILIFERMILKSKWFSSFLSRYEKAITKV